MRVSRGWVVADSRSIRLRRISSMGQDGPFISLLFSTKPDYQGCGQTWACRTKGVGLNTGRKRSQRC